MKHLTYLRVKIKSLAEEATIIRHEERKTLKRRDWFRNRQGPNEVVEHYDSVYVGLHTHRTYDVRNEARAAQLALGFLRGKTYDQVEMKGSKSPNIRRVAEIARKFGFAGTASMAEAGVEAWINAAYAEPQQEEAQA